MIKQIEVNLWGRDFVLPIEYDCYSGENITTCQIKAVEIFKNNESLINCAKKEVEKYCSQMVKNDVNNHKKDNIFSYIKPDYIFVKREEEPRVAIMCKYRYDQEHGLAIVIDLDGRINVGLQDIIL